MSNNTTNDYTADEMLVCEYLNRITNNLIGCGTDPIQFLISSHEALTQRIKGLEAELYRVRASLEAELYYQKELNEGLRTENDYQAEQLESLRRLITRNP
jgi:hypothetical protein